MCGGREAANSGSRSRPVRSPSIRCVGQMARRPDHAIHRPPGFCGVCGLLFEAPIGIANSTVTLAGNTANCPRCGSREAVIIDGTYSAFQDRLEIALAPTVSAQARDALLALIAQVRDNKVSLEEAKNQAEKINPRFGSIFDIANWSVTDKVTLMSAIIVAAATVAQPVFAPTPPTPHIELVLPQIPGVRNLRDALLSSSSSRPVQAIPPDLQRNEHNRHSHDKHPKADDKHHPGKGPRSR